MDLLAIADLNKSQLEAIFHLADEICENKTSDILAGKLVLLIFPSSSVRTIISFKRGVQLLGGDTISFPTEVLERREELVDQAGYMNNWVDMAIVRYPSLDVITQLSQYAQFPVINAMTSENHPCEIITDLYTLSIMYKNYTELKYIFVGPENNVCNSWMSAAKLLNLNLTQVCPAKHKSRLVTDGHESVKFSENLPASIAGADVVLTDSVPDHMRTREYFDRYQITSELMATANANAILNPCPPFFRGEEIAADLIESRHFVGYEFKHNLLPVQMAIMTYCFRN